MTYDELQKHLKSGKSRSFTFSDGSTETYRDNAKRIICADGFELSVQASSTHYCEPRNMDGPYISVEIGFPSQCEELLMRWAEDEDKPTDTIYGYVPIQIALRVINNHGGVKQEPLP